MANGERVRQYKIEAKVGGKWQTICTGESSRQQTYSIIRPGRDDGIAARYTSIRCHA